MKEFDIDGEPIEAAAAQAAEIYAQLIRGLESRPVSPRISGEELASVFEDSIPERGVGLVRALEEFRDKIVPASMATPHPLYLGLVNCSPLPAAPLADLLVSALNNNNGAAGQGPAAAAAEREIVAAFSRLTFGHGESSGMMLPGGSYATLQALAMARARHFPEWSSLGPASVKSRPVLYTSDASHFSVSRAAQVLGLGENGVTSIGTRGRGAIDRDALEQRIERDRAAGARPFAVVATLGTTGTGAIDPVDALADCCQRHGLWLHVDACYGGGALLLDRFRSRFGGIEHADSIALDPHKWFFLPLTHSLLLVRDPGAELSTFDVGATYIPHRENRDAYRRGIPTSRRASPLTLWMTLRAHGWETIREAVRRNITLTRNLEQRLREHRFRVLPDGELSIACVRWEPPGWGHRESDDLQNRIAAKAIQSGETWFSTVNHDGRTWLRLNILNLYTRSRHIEHFAERLAEWAREESRLPVPDTEYTG